MLSKSIVSYESCDLTRNIYMVYSDLYNDDIEKNDQAFHL